MATTTLAPGGRSWGRSRPALILALSALLRVARAGGQAHGQAIQLLADDDLAAEAGSLGQAEGEVEHVLLVLAGLGQQVVPFVLDDDMAGRAGERALARTFEVDIVLMRD